MPWPTGEGFAAKHNKKLKGEAATKAAHVASALVEKGEDEGRAIRIANAIGNRTLSNDERAKRRYGKA